MPLIDVCGRNAKFTFLLFSPGDSFSALFVFADARWDTAQCIREFVFFLCLQFFFVYKSTEGSGRWMKNGNIIKIFSWHYTLFEPLAACGGWGDGNITELTDLLLIAFRLTLNLMFILMCWWLHSMAYGAGVMGGRMGWMASRKIQFLS